MKGKNKTLLLRRILSGEVWRKTKNNGRQVCPPTARGDINKGSKMTASATLSQENVISPSKMKQRSRNSKAAKSSLLTLSPIDDPPPHFKLIKPLRESRDDIDFGSSVRYPSSSSVMAPTTPGRSSSSMGGGIRSSSFSSHQATPHRSKNNTSSSNSSIGVYKSSKDGTTMAMDLTTTSTTTENLVNEGEESPRSKLQKKLLSNLRPPDPALADLLNVLTDFDQTSHLRRVNACGAIKTLTIHKANQIPLARTKGVVPSITSVLCAVNATEEERTRCINALMHLCVPQENWKLVYMFPQTPEALARNMADKFPQIRYAACLATSFLAKKNRRDVINNRLLMYAMARVLEVDKNGALDTMSTQDRKVFVGARLCVLKMILHLSKNKDVSTTLARTECVMASLVSVASKMEQAANILCVAIMTNLTRHPDNAYYLVYKVPDLVATFVYHIESADSECKKCALYGLQNLSCASNCRQDLANMTDLLGNITKAAFRHDHPEEQLSALHTLKNLSDDPFNLVTMTNTPGCTATLLALANNDSAAAAATSSSGGGESGGTNNNNNKKKNGVIEHRGMAQYLACDTLATLSHWLLTLSTTRKSKENTASGGNGGTTDGNSGKSGVERRTFKQNTWEEWS